MNKICNTVNVKKDLKLIGLVMSSMFLLGMLVWFIVMKISEADTTATMGAFMVTVGGVIFLILWGTLGLKNRFETAVCMSRTRRDFIVKEGVGTVIVVCAVLLLGMLLSGLDSFLQKEFCQGIPVELDMRQFYEGFLMKPINFVTVTLMIFSLRFLFGAMFLKWGQKFFWVVWAVWMICCMLPERIAAVLEGRGAGKPDFGKLVEMSHRLGGYFWQLILCALAFFIFSAALLLLRKQEAKGY